MRRLFLTPGLSRPGFSASTILLAIACHSASAADQADSSRTAIDFAHQIAPILKQHCVECHGGDEAKGGFSVNTRELFLESGMAVPGQPEDSHFLSLVTSDDVETQMPPQDRARVPDEKVALLRRWVDEGMQWDAGFTFAENVYEPPLKPRRPELPPTVDGRSNPVDRLIDQWLVEHDRPGPPPISDAAFLRRVHLDLIGLLPTPEELKEFLSDQSPEKRSRVVRELLEDDIRYTEHWLTFFNDLLRNDYSGTGFITGGRKQISGWLYQALLNNRPFDEFTTELIAPPTDASRGYIDGIKWRGDVSAAQKLPIQFAQSVSQSFLGINMKCASCHDSFIDRWTLQEAYGLAAIYSNQPLEIHRCDKPTGETAEASWLFPELGQIDPEAPRDRRLEQMAALMTHPENGRFTRTIVNRLWGQLMGRGIVHPLDAMQTEPWNADLLDYLAVHLQDNDYDLKSVLELIATSRAYQSATEVRTDRTDGSGYVYAGPRARRLTAEQFVDAIWHLTDSAPTRFDAPVARGEVDPGELARIEIAARWMWGDSAADGTPPAGESVAFRRTVKIEKPVLSAGAVVTCDNEYRLFVNNAEVSSGSNWTKPAPVTLTKHLKRGKNSIIVIAKNGGSSPNAAGFFLEGRVNLEDGSSQVIRTDEKWTVAASFPQKTRVRRWKLEEIAWKPATIVPTLDAWREAIEPVAPRLLLEASVGTDLLVRASLMKSDFLMRSLGRPNRDQIVSSRPSELTTLEAIDLSNNQKLADALARGGKILADRQWPDTDALIDYLYLATLTRHPTEDERRVVHNYFDGEPSEEEIADLLWALCMTPEFLLIR